jgi:hypothetical protein
LESVRARLRIADQTPSTHGRAGRGPIGDDASSQPFILETAMNPYCSDTETTVRHHLEAFLEQQGLDAIVNDYADDACFLSEGRAYCGKPAIREFFEAFIASLPPQAIAEFTLRSLRVHSDVAYITWSAGPELPLGTDTFVVRKGRIVAQTFAMVRAPAN